MLVSGSGAVFHRRQWHLMPSSELIALQISKNLFKEKDRGTEEQRLFLVCGVRAWPDPIRAEPTGGGIGRYVGPCRECDEI